MSDVSVELFVENKGRKKKQEKTRTRQRFSGK